MKNEPIGKAYLVVDEKARHAIDNRRGSLGLFIAEFDTLEEAREFVVEENNPNFAIIGPKVN